MHDSDSISASLKDTVKGYWEVGRKLVTVTATSASSHDSLIDTLLHTTFPACLVSGETGEEFAERVAETAGLTVAKQLERGGEEARICS